MNFIKKIFHWKIALLSNIIYGFPSKKMILIGVTGTKGKSSTCRFIASILEKAGYNVGLLSTVEIQINKERHLNNKKMTMLGRGLIQKMLKKMVKSGCQYAVVETSSEGILQYRHLGIDYDIVVFTNLGEEHSERHGGFENLKKDKGKIFANLKNKKNKIINGKKIDKIIIVNADDVNHDYFFNFNADKKIKYGIKNNRADIIGQIISSDENGTNLRVGDNEFKILVPGNFNTYNALSAIAVAKSQSINEARMAEGISSVKNIKGRMEKIIGSQPFQVIVDYAHEPMSIQCLFESLKKFNNFNGKLIGVIGSDGGGRDKKKRHKIGYLSAKYCDYVVITDVNCYNEDPVLIAQMVASGVQDGGKIENKSFFIEIDRYKAIKKAFSLAGKGDMVVITAKGSEPFMAMAKGKKLPWNDSKISKELLQKMGYLYDS
jgi:UDP-N-acetylmuramoyl-L-alanyl-D-glutamate--2,6-diaminopimelate ligase